MLDERSILKIHIPAGVLKMVPPETVEDKFSRKAEAMSKWHFQKITIWYDFHFMQSPKIFHKVSLTIKLK